MDAIFDAINQILDTYICTNDSIEEHLGIFISEEGITLEDEDDICTIGLFYPLCSFIQVNSSGKLEIIRDVANSFYH